MGLRLQGGEGKGAYTKYVDDDGDDNSDFMEWNTSGTAHGAEAHCYVRFLVNGSWDNEFLFYNDGRFQSESTMHASTNTDYAEFFEWKTKLANNVTEEDMYGQTVVLDGGKIRVAVEGEESKVLGVIRPKGTSSIVGGGEGFKWRNKYLKNVWGENIMEEYTSVLWKIYDDDGNEIKKYSYHKDRIPQYELINEPIDDEPGWWNLESNFKLDDDGNKIPLVVPKTNAQKSAMKYKEESVWKKGKMEEKKDIGGTKKMRKKVNPDYDPTKPYISREDRPKEWGIVGLLGQVEIRDTAIIPTHWIKMKNLESGIDLYYIK